MEDVGEDQRDNFENVACVPEEGDGVIDMDYKKLKLQSTGKVVKPKQRSVEGMKKDFEKVKSLRQSYRREESMNTGGTHTDKLRFITVHMNLFITKFQSRMNDGKIIHDMELRR